MMPPQVAHPGPPTLVAHRGDPSSWPENTRPAVAAAVEAGAAAIEIDVQLSADRVPVLMHDGDLLRTCGVSGPVTALTADELAALGVCHGADRVPVPALAALVDDLRDTAVELFVEIKRAAVERFGVESVVARVAEDLRPLGGRAVVIAFDDRVVAHARDAHALAIGWILRADDDAHRARATALAPDVLVCRVDRLAAADGRSSLPAGPWRWMVYTVDDADAVLAWGRRGAALVETDRVSALLRDPRLRGEAARRG